MHRIAIPVTPGLPLFELAVPCEVFGSRQDFPVPWWYEVQLCGVQDGAARTGEGLLFDGAFGLRELSQADTVIVPACASVQDDPPPALLDALRAGGPRSRRADRIPLHRRLHPRGGGPARRPAGGHALDARRRSRPPLVEAVQVEPNVLYTDGGRILTSAGSSAGLDLCLHIVRQDHGTRIANALARRLVIPPHRDGGQAQYIEQPVPVDNSRSLLAPPWTGPGRTWSCP